MPLLRLAYVSISQMGAAPALWNPKLDAIILSARRFNLSNAITGYLMFDGLEFAQILEGDVAAVMGTFLRINSDHNHHGIRVIERRPVRQRQFADWTMGLAVREGPMEPAFRECGVMQPGDMGKRDGDAMLHLAQRLREGSGAVSI